MKVTVCQLHDSQLAADWKQLKTHVQAERSDLVLLPEMPFAPWFAAVPDFDSAVWRRTVDAHDEWLGRLEELSPAVVLGSLARNHSGQRRNTGFVFESGVQLIHDKYYLPDEAGFWEASWYGRGTGDFVPVMARDALIGFQICTEMWFTEHARAYGQQGVHIVAVPRATPKVTNDKWLAGGRATAVISGAYCLSSNRAGAHETGLEFGGMGWVIDPEGEVLAVTSTDEPFVTIQIDLSVAEQAKSTYPRYVQS